MNPAKYWAGVQNNSLLISHCYWREDTKYIGYEILNPVLFPYSIPIKISYLQNINPLIIQNSLGRGLEILWRDILNPRWFSLVIGEGVQKLWSRYPEYWSLLPFLIPIERRFKILQLQNIVPLLFPIPIVEDRVSKNYGLDILTPTSTHFQFPLEKGFKTLLPWYIKPPPTSYFHLRGGSNYYACKILNPLLIPILFG